MLNTFWLEPLDFDEKKSPCSQTSRYFASICSGLYVFSYVVAMLDKTVILYNNYQQFNFYFILLG